MTLEREVLLGLVRRPALASCPRLDEEADTGGSYTSQNDELRLSVMTDDPRWTIGHLTLHDDGAVGVDARRSDGSNAVALGDPDPVERLTALVIGLSHGERRPRHGGPVRVGLGRPR